MRKNKIKKLLFGNLGFLIGFIVLFSPGFLGLSITDASVIRAALSVTMGIMMPVGMVIYNYKTLSQKEEHKYIGTNQYSVEEIRQELQHYLGSGLFGQVARSSLDQLDKCEKMQAGVNEILNRKFDKGSLTYHRFDTIAGNAQNTVMANMVNMLNRMRVIDDGVYARLLNYKHDDIPDDIQIQQLELYNKNIAAVKEQRNQNERLIYKLDELRLELAASESVDAAGIKAYAEIDTLIKQIEYYQN